MTNKNSENVFSNIKAVMLILLFTALLFISFINTDETIAGGSQLGTLPVEVDDKLTTEDGIVTFKYEVTHTNSGGNQSYIYNLNGYNYQTLPKELAIQLYKQSDHSLVDFPNLTEIRVYYSRYINGAANPSKTVVGTYTTHNDDRVYLTEFKLLDLETDAFSKYETYGHILGGNTSVKEVYNFIITPPNGYSNNVKDEIIDYVYEYGYCTEKDDNADVQYLEGTATGASELESSKQEKLLTISPSRKTSLKQETDGTYTFVDDNTFNLYDVKLTNTQVSNSEYISLTSDSIIESSILGFSIKKLTIKVGYNVGNLDIYGKETESSEWVKVSELDTYTDEYKQYVIDFNDGSGNYPYYAYKISNVSSNEIRITEIDLLSNDLDILHKTKVSDFREELVSGGTYTYGVYDEVLGDSRHDSKKFMLAIQLAQKANTSTLISSIVGSIYININNIGMDVTHNVNLNEFSGKNTAFINLSEILESLNVKEINFTINFPSDYAIHAVQLLEASNEYKPSSSEVRYEHIYAHTHYYIDSVCKCGAVQDGYVSLIDEFANTLVNDLNTAGGNTTTTISDFDTTAISNFKSAFSKSTYLHKYLWFFEFVKSEMIAVATASNSLTDANYLKTIDLLNKIIVGLNVGTPLYDDSYSNSVEAICYFIDALINKKSLEEIINETYKKFMVEYSDDTNRARFLNAYEHSKITIKIGIFDRSGLAAGNGLDPDHLPINYIYMSDSMIHPSVSGDSSKGNSLVWQSKILLKKITKNTYQIVDVGNATGSTSTNVASTKIGQWTHVLATTYGADFVHIYSQHVGKYMIIDEDDMGTQYTDYSFKEDLYNAAANMTFDGYVEGKIVSSIPSTGKDIFVAKDGSGNYTTIQSAINAANSGDTIYIGAGTYTEDITFNKNDISVQGPNYGVPSQGSRSTEAIIDGDITVNGVTGVELSGFRLINYSGVLLKTGTSDFTFEHNKVDINYKYNATTHVATGYSGVVCVEGENDVVSNIKVNHNTCDDYISPRFIRIDGIVNGFEAVGNYIIGKDDKAGEYTYGDNLYDFINAGCMKGVVNISNNTVSNSNQSFIYVKAVGVMDCIVSNNVVTNIANTGVDFRQMNEDGHVSIVIKNNTFRNVGMGWNDKEGWRTIRVRTAGYDANDSISVVVNNNKFIESYLIENSVPTFMNNPSFAAQVDPFKVIYTVGRNYYVVDGSVYTSLSNANFGNAALSYGAAYTSEAQVPSA